jgi:hypothetical protein
MKDFNIEEHCERCWDESSQVRKIVEEIFCAKHYEIYQNEPAESNPWDDDPPQWERDI